MSWKYRQDELTVLSGSGTPTAAVTDRAIYVDIDTGRTFTNLGGGSTWANSGLGAVETLTAARVLVAADSGKTFLLNLAGGFDVTLPALTTTGFSAKFIVKTAPTTAYTITGATADKMAGSIFEATGAASDTEAAATGDVLNFVANTAVVGDQADVFCDGAAYYVKGFCSAAGGMTITG